MSPQRCGNGKCREPGVLRCSKCKWKSYCTKICQKAHWKKHKMSCHGPGDFPPFMPGVFNFFGLPREIRNKIYEELVVALRSRGDRTEYEKLAASRHEPDSERKRFKRMDELDVRLMVKPGHSEQDGTTGFQPLLDVHGMSLANKQVNREFMTTLFSKNRFFLSVDDKHPYWVPGQFLRAIMAPNHLAQIKHLYIDVDTKLQPYEADYRKGVVVVNYSVHHIVKTLNSVGKGLKSLTVNHISCYRGEIEELRRDADILATRNHVRNIQVMRPDHDIQELDSKGIKEFFLHSNNIANAISQLTIPVKKFRMFGDVSGNDIQRLYHKFGVINNDVDEHKDNRDENGQKCDWIQLIMEDMAAALPGLQDATAQAHLYAIRPVMTVAVGRVDGGAMLLGSPDGAPPINMPNGCFGGAVPLIYPPR
ncbi:hypothetical protein D6C86_05169 [Aureobasidium pullulans]|uniref:MYND-type domain-containing protein n=1 Tax=Aureobasidium pullulans TaxID=5580 RepID=A0A4S9VW86_AURPU|nr:hypothetical protein D6C94_09947 [Aureobasidium pullulans]THZ38883.1 hypothetical protein D6C87_07513 [Aureobasidium pullulans]THZ56246.1 hypothetical protein D6C88_09285 [Aureobasidium pullulans]THZ60167.1 hypothetical protein D6C86_05169 [Aureobasidium pullulans]